MQFEGWFAIGDSIVILPSGVAGIVEETSLRATKLRSLTGEVIFVNNSQISAVRVLPRGVRQVSIELAVRDEVEGRRLFEDAARVMPVGPTQFVRLPWIEAIERLDDDLVLLRGRAAVAPGREWLAAGLSQRRLAGARGRRVDRARARRDRDRRAGESSLRPRHVRFGARLTQKPLSGSCS